MNYENTKHKVRTVFTQSDTNTNSITSLNDSNNAALHKKAIITLPKINFNHVRQLTTDWSISSNFTVETIKSFDLETGTFEIELQNAAYQEWNIEIDEIPEKYLPFLDYKIQIQRNDEVTWLDNYYTASILHKLSESNGIYNIRLAIGWSREIEEKNIQIKSRLLFVVSNPQIFR